MSDCRRQESKQFRTEKGRSLVKIAQFRKEIRRGILAESHLVVQDHAQKRTVDFQPIVVVDETKLPELVHEEAHSGPCRSDHFSQCFLADLRNHWLLFPVLAEIGQ